MTRDGLNCARFNAEFRPSPRWRFQRSCPPTSILVKSADRTSKHFSQCAMSHFASAQRTFADCRNGAMERLSVCSALGPVLSSRVPAFTSLIIEVTRIKRQPNKKRPPRRLLWKNQPRRKKPVPRLWQEHRQRHLRKRRQKNRADELE